MVDLIGEIFDQIIDILKIGYRNYMNYVQQ